jgi:hypothetical protein
VTASFYDLFDQPKTQSAATITPITPRPTNDRINPYAAKAISYELARLDRLPRPWVPGASYWDTTTFEVACNLLELANSPWTGYTHADAEHDLYAHAPADQAWGRRQHEAKWTSALQRVGAAGRPEPAPTETWEPPAVTLLDDRRTTPELVLDEVSFWSARPILTHIHDFARARRVSPWAVLGVTLARITTATPPQVCLPPIVGGKASLNLFVGLVGPSGAGKGAAEAVAADAVHVGHIVSHNVGSGEGIAHGYKKRVRGGDLEWVDDRHAVLFSVPEIDSLAAQGDRKGATLMPQLRSGWTGEQLGFGYADPTKRIIVEAHQYRLCLVAGIQPGRAGCLLDDADGGTPQRFLWLPATDPHAPDTPPAEPEPWHWTPPRVGDIVGIGGAPLQVCDQARDTIVTARLARLRGDGHALDGHALLAQLKTAAALALADERLDVNDDDWHLAHLVAAKSTATRQAVIETLKAKAHTANVDRAEAEAMRAITVADRVADAAEQRVARALRRRLERAADGLPRRELRGSLASRDRGLFDAALTHLVDAGQVTVDDANNGTHYRLADNA